MRGGSSIEPTYDRKGPENVPALQFYNIKGAIKGKTQNFMHREVEYYR